MDCRNDMGIQTSVITSQFLGKFIEKYGIDPSLGPIVPPPGATVRDVPHGMVSLYTAFFSFSNFRIPVSYFLESVMTYYEIHISQVVPLGLIRVYHFDISCRALRIEAEINLFRAFYKATRVGDWVTFEKRKFPYPSHTLRPPTSLKNWKNRFFFISARAIPFEMHWSMPKESLRDPIPKPREYSKVDYDKIKAVPTALRPFSEHFLVMVGISRNWDDPTLRPTLYYNGERMGLFDHMKLSSKGDVEEVVEPIKPGQKTILDKTKDFIIPTAESESKRPSKRKVTAGGGKGATSRGSPGETSFQTDHDYSSEDGSDPSIDLNNSKGLSGSANHEVDLNVPFVPDWSFRVGNTVETPESCREFMFSARTPADRARYKKMSDKEVSNLGFSSAVSFFNSYTDTNERWLESLRVNRGLKKDLSRATARHLELETENQLLKSGFENERNVFSSQISVLRDEVARLESERSWLISTGMQQAFEKVRSSDEFLDMLGDLNSLADKVGYNGGLKEGVGLGKKGKKAQDSNQFHADALEQLRELSDKFDSCQFPMSASISGMVSSTLADIQAFLAPTK
ncbi:hypothetical protein L1987_03772 [Smallanthus sonchifolius]|uniref:Uncharacterized protein n=1 Tax=Smallanthus sonchifolius TaxID=185202 RepID=A0ACB9KBR1_9ASTR|nr:hypothetical protein L1987_03772 [Smallanthus sonchifolius]